MIEQRVEMPSSVTPLLDQARAAVAKHQVELALAPLLRAWSAVRDPELADVIERLSSRLARDRPPLAGSTRAELERSWRERAESADAIELGALLPSLADIDSHQARRRLKLISRHAPDPRIASALTSIVLSPPFTASSTAKFWQTLHALLRECPDPRALARLEQAHALEPNAASTLVRLDSWRRRSVESLREQLAGLDTVLNLDDRARLDPISAALEHAEATSVDAGPELYAAVIEAPEQLERRQVYADYLLSIGDPRGEFIALQLAGDRDELDRAGKARMKALLEQHGSAWLGGVGAALVRSRTRFRNGFLSRARIKQNHRGLDRLLGDPVWATVTSLEHAPPRLVFDSIMRSLRSISWSSYQLIAATREQASLPKIERLSIEGEPWVPYDRRGHFDEDLRVALEHPTLLPKLRSLELDVRAELGLDQLAWLWAGPLGARLHRLELRWADDGTVGLSGYLRSLRASNPDGLVELRISNRLLRCSFERADGAWTRAKLDPGPDPTPGGIDIELRLLRDLDALELDLDPQIRTET